jgi:holo-[acyl-carrier protein] synthase
MIYGIGVDVVRIGRIKEVIERWEERFLNRVFTRQEIDFCRSRVHRVSCFAMRFAAKEAFAKALGTGMRHRIYWRQIEVFHDKRGKPEFRLNGHALELVRQANISRLHLSLTDESEYAAAMVVLEC